jgi:hypothetical protein
MINSGFERHGKTTKRARLEGVGMRISGGISNMPEYCSMIEHSMNGDYVK